MRDVRSGSSQLPTAASQSGHVARLELRSRHISQYLRSVSKLAGWRTLNHPRWGCVQSYRGSTVPGRCLDRMARSGYRVKDIACHAALVLPHDARTGCGRTRRLHRFSGALALIGRVECDYNAEEGLMAIGYMLDRK